MARNTRTWTEAHVRRLFWRAGFGPTPREVRHWTRAGRARAIAHVVHGPKGGGALLGPRPTVKGRPIDPLNEYGHDVLWWLDRMVRSTWPLQEKLTLFWHDHFATRDQDTPLMLRQNRMLRQYGMGSFRRLLRQVTRDPAMQLFLSLADSHKDSPNENYARELMELFTLAAGYDERDVREAARALTGWRVSRRDGQVNGTWFDKERHDDGVKRLLGHRGRLGTQEVLDLVVDKPRHAPFLVSKLWDFFVTEPLDKGTRRALVAHLPGRRRAHPARGRGDPGSPRAVRAPRPPRHGQEPGRLPGRSAARGARADHDGRLHVAALPHGADAVPPAERRRLGLGHRLADERHDQGAPRRRQQPHRLGRRRPAARPRPGRQARPQAARAGRPRAARARRPVDLRHDPADPHNVAAHYFDDLTKPSQGDEQSVKRAAMLQRTLRNLMLSGPDAHLH